MFKLEAEDTGNYKVILESDGGLENASNIWLTVMNYKAGTDLQLVLDNYPQPQLRITEYTTNTHSGIPKPIIKKTIPLTEEEYNNIRRLLLAFFDPEFIKNTILAQLGELISDIIRNRNINENDLGNISNLLSA